MKSLVGLLLWLGAVSAAAVDLSRPVWLISPETNEHNGVKVEGVEVDRSNNNLAIAIYKGRLYFAFRTATHHHPKPPLWVPRTKETASAKTRLYVLSAAAPTDFSDDFEKAVSRLKWRLELEVSDSLKEVFKNNDAREPIFYEMNGKLHFQAMLVEGVSMKFNPLRSYHWEFDGKAWSKAVPILNEKDHGWEVQVVKREGKEVAYQTSYVGQSYAFGRTDPKKGGPLWADLKTSTDGVTWKSVSKKGSIYEGGVSEMAFAILPKTDEMWSVMRLEDADKRGYGTLVGKAPMKDLTAWDLPEKANPLRHDSPRMFVDDDTIFVIARLNVGPDGDEKVNYPFDTKEAIQNLKLPESIGFSQLLMGKAEKLAAHYHFNRPKRTVLYRLSTTTRELEYVQTLPSAGDTAFPSIQPVTDGKGRRRYLVGNYSSPVEKKDWSWGTGQDTRTGIYLILLTP